MSEKFIVVEYFVLPDKSIGKILACSVPFETYNDAKDYIDSILILKPKNWYQIEKIFCS